MTGPHDDPAADAPSGALVPDESHTLTEYPDDVESEYPEGMNRVLAANPGLPSRFNPNQAIIIEGE